MSKAFVRWLTQKLVVEGAESSVMQTAAKKAVQLERKGGEKLGIWLGAAVAEISQDVSSVLGAGSSSSSAPEETGKAKEQGKIKGGQGGTGAGPDTGKH